MRIVFNKPYMTGRETEYIAQAVMNGHISGDGSFTKKCHGFFENRYGFHKCLLTTSCTDGLEMAAILAEIGPGDEVIIPSYTFVSTANAFVLRGAKIVFADSLPDHPNLDTDRLEELITDRTKAIAVVHYAGHACEMDKVTELARKYNLFVIEDAAQAIDSQYKGRPLGGIGDFAAFSFHETKNIISGEGGMICVNNPKFAGRAEIIREKGTNRSAFFRGEVDKYGWSDVGSSFLPSDIIGAFLFAQLENLEKIQLRRKQIAKNYEELLKPVFDAGLLERVRPAAYATDNAHMFAIVCRSAEEQNDLLQAFRAANIVAVFHYLSLHKSAYFADKHDGRELPNADKFSNQLIRLPFFFEITDEQQEKVAGIIRDFFKI